MEDLNRTYASLLTNGSVLFGATALSPLIKGREGRE